jgi:hypothetical protein
MRSLKPEYFDDEELCVNSSRDARLLYPGLWCHADEHCRVRGNPAWIKGKVFPYDDDLGPAEIERLIDELAALGKVVRYRVNGASYLYLPNLGKHQRLDTDKVPSRLPPPPDDDPDPRPSGKFPDGSGTGAESPEDVEARARASLKQVAGGMQQAAGGNLPASPVPAAAIAEIQVHTDATDVEAEAVARAVADSRRNVKSLVGLIRTMGPAGDLKSFLDDVRVLAAKAHRSRALAAARDGPPCEHGTPGGALLHPDSGEPWCVSCRMATRRAAEGAAA